MLVSRPTPPPNPQPNPRHRHKDGREAACSAGLRWDRVGCRLRTGSGREVDRRGRRCFGLTACVRLRSVASTKRRPQRPTPHSHPRMAAGGWTHGVGCQRCFPSSCLWPVRFERTEACDRRACSQRELKPRRRVGRGVVSGVMVSRSASQLACSDLACARTRTLRAPTDALLTTSAHRRLWPTTTAEKAPHRSPL